MAGNVVDVREGSPCSFAGTAVVSEAGRSLGTAGTRVGVSAVVARLRRCSRRCQTGRLALLSRTDQSRFDWKTIHSFASVDSASPVTSVQSVAGWPAHRAPGCS